MNAAADALLRFEHEHAQAHGFESRRGMQAREASADDDDVEVRAAQRVVLGSSDDFTTATWAGVGLGPQDLKSLQWTDFEVVDGGPEIVWSAGDCTRMQIQN